MPRTSEVDVEMEALAASVKHSIALKVALSISQ